MGSKAFGLFALLCLANLLTQIQGASYIPQFIKGTPKEGNVVDLTDGITVTSLCVEPTVQIAAAPAPSAPCPPASNPSSAGSGDQASEQKTTEAQLQQDQLMESVEPSL